MRDMTPFTDWSAALPLIAHPLFACVTTSGSLTEYLQASGRAFSVDVLQQGMDIANADELAVFDLSADQAVFARHVCLRLDGVAVVVARSLCLPDAGLWRDILDRGSRSLGYTLFGGTPGLSRGELQYRTLADGHMLHALAQPFDTRNAAHYQARRCLFDINNQSLMVCEVFLPQLESLLK